MGILIKNILLNSKETDILIEENRIEKIGKNLAVKAEYKIDGKSKAVVPGLINAHTHAAMTLFRGYADDVPLQEWLEQKIWPLEARLTENDVYWGTKLACLEMIKSGTTFFNDMYWHFLGSARAVEEMGIKAALSAVFIDLFDQEKAEEQIKLNEKLFRKSRQSSNRIIFALGPHAVYTVSKESLQWVKEFSDKHDLLIHIHLSETEREVKDSVKNFGKRPVEYLNDLDFLGPNIIACHSIWLNDKEIRILAKNNVNLVYNPLSNLKLASGMGFRYKQITNANINVTIGTDGCASNNNLDMFDSMKFAALLQKTVSNNPTVLPAGEAFKLATINGANAFRLDAGEIKEGKLADLLLIDLKRPELTPLHNLTSHIVYSANGGCVDTMICDGKILMQNRKVKGEEEILEKAGRVAHDLINRT